MVDAAHFIGLVAGKAIPSPVPYADVVTLHDAQGAARPARRHDRVQAGARAADRQGGLPVPAGRPADARGRGQGGGAARSACSRRTRRTPARSSPTRRRSPTALAAEGMRPVSGGTDTHLALLDLRELGVTGTRGRGALRRGAGITLNKNAIPYDPQPPMIASGIRVGTPAVTTQGMTEGDMKEVASLIGRAVRDADGQPAAETRAPRSAPCRRTPRVPAARLGTPARARVPPHPGASPRPSPTC